MSTGSESTHGSESRFQAVLDLYEAMLSSASLQDACRLCVSMLRERFGVARCSLWLLDGEVARGTYSVSEQGTLTDMRQQHIRPPVDFGPAGWQASQTARQDPVDGVLGALDRGWVVQTAVTARGRLVGVLVNDSGSAGQPLDPELQHLLAQFGARLGTIIERCRSSEAETAEARQMGLVLEGANCAYWHLDLTSGQSSFSPAFARMLGYDWPAEHSAMVLGEWMAYVHPDDQALFAEAVDRHLTGRDERIDLVLRCMRNDGQPVWAELLGKVVCRDDAGRPRRLAGIVRDVTREVQSQRALADSEKRLRTMITALPDVVMVVGADGRLREPPTGEVAAMPLLSAVSPLFGSLPPGPAREFREALAATLESGAPSVVNLPWRVGARTNWFEARLARLTADAAIVVARDVTMRRQLEDQLRQVSKMEAVGVLAGGVAHEFNNLLTTIMGHAELLLADPGGVQRRRQGLRQIVDSCQRAGDLTQQLLGFGRKQMRRPKLLDLCEMLRRCRERLEALLGRCNGLFVDLPATTVPVLADEPQLQMVLTSLVANARDAMPDGGLVSISVSVSGQQALLQVMDSGVGMTPELQRRIFEPFFTTKEVGQGRGMSLAVVDGVIAQHGGSIEVYSTEGIGSCLEVRLPLIGEPTATADYLEQPAPTILLVDDDWHQRQAAERSITERGYRVVSWCDPQQAAEWAAESDVAISLLVACAELPGMSGGQLVAKLRARRPELPVLLLYRTNNGSTTASGGDDQSSLGQRVADLLASGVG